MFFFLRGDGILGTQVIDVSENCEVCGNKLRKEDGVCPYCDYVDNEELE